MQPPPLTSYAPCQTGVNRSPTTHGHTGLGSYPLQSQVNIDVLLPHARFYTLTLFVSVGQRTDRVVDKKLKT